MMNTESAHYDDNQKKVVMLSFGILWQRLTRRKRVEESHAQSIIVIGETNDNWVHFFRINLKI